MTQDVPEYISDLVLLVAFTGPSLLVAPGVDAVVLNPEEVESCSSLTYVVLKYTWTCPHAGPELPKPLASPGRGLLSLITSPFGAHLTLC